MLAALRIFTTVIGISCFRDCTPVLYASQTSIPRPTKRTPAFYASGTPLLVAPDTSLTISVVTLYAAGTPIPKRITRTLGFYACLIPTFYTPLVRTCQLLLLMPILHGVELAPQPG